MLKSYTNISFNYLDKKVFRKVCYFLDKHLVCLSPPEAFLIVNTTMNGKTISIRPAKEAKIEQIIRRSGGCRYESLNKNHISIKIGKTRYNMYTDPK